MDAVTYFNSIAPPIGNAIELIWHNPKTEELCGVRILRKTTDAIGGPADPTATVVYDDRGKEQRYCDYGLKNNIQYFYWIYAYDRSHNFSVPLSTSSVPRYSIDGYQIDLKHELYQILTDGLKNKNYDAKVIKGASWLPGDLPCFLIIRRNDEESESTAGAYFDEWYDKINSKWVQQHGLYFSETIEIRIICTNNDMRDDLYVVAKQILFENKERLTDRGVLTPQITGGADEDGLRYDEIPEVIYSTPITVNVLNPVLANKKYDRIEIIETRPTVKPQG